METAATVQAAAGAKHVTKAESQASRHKREAVNVAMLQHAVAWLTKRTEPFMTRAAMLKAMAAGFEYPGDKRSPDALQAAFGRTLERVIACGHAEDMPRSGHPKKVQTPDDHTIIAACVQAYMAGHGVIATRSRWWGYTSIEHAAAECTLIANTLRRFETTPRVLLAWMTAHKLATTGKGFNIISVHVRQGLKQETMDERLAKAKLWSTWSMDKIIRIVWVDEKKEARGSYTYRCVAPDDMPSHWEGRDTTDSAMHAHVLAYIAAVCGVLGPVYLQFITGTSGKPLEFMVRTAVPCA
jgi:hypothetical protein